MTEEKELVTLVEDVKNAIAAGSISPKALMNVVDDNKDGRISLAELRNHRWTILITLIAMLAGYVGGNMQYALDMVQVHWVAVMISGGALLIGYLLGVIFPPPAASVTPVNPPENAQ